MLRAQFSGVKGLHCCVASTTINIENVFIFPNRKSISINTNFLFTNPCKPSSYFL